MNECSIVVLFGAVRITSDAFPAEALHKSTNWNIYICSVVTQAHCTCIRESCKLESKIFCYVGIRLRYGFSGSAEKKRVCHLLNSAVERQDQSRPSSDGWNQM